MDFRRNFGQRGGVDHHREGCSAPDIRHDHREHGEGQQPGCSAEADVAQQRVQRSVGGEEGVERKGCDDLRHNPCDNNDATDQGGENLGGFAHEHGKGKSQDILADHSRGDDEDDRQQDRFPECSAGQQIRVVLEADKFRICCFVAREGGIGQRPIHRICNGTYEEHRHEGNCWKQKTHSARLAGGARK